MLGYTPQGVGMETPWVWAWRHPLSVGLEDTPSWVWAWRPPQVWAWRPPLARPLSFPPRCGPGDPPHARHAGIPPARHAGIPPPGYLQCMLRYHPPPIPVNRMTDRCKNITLPQTSFAAGNYTSDRNLLLSTCPYLCEGGS